jgi:hypothetical protein
MRKFRFIGEPVNTYYLLFKNGIYNQNEIVESAFKDLDDKDWTVLMYVENDPESWEEIFINHKETDLGYFAGLALQSILMNTENFGTDTDFQIEMAIHKAKKLIKQLDQEQ